MKRSGWVFPFFAIVLLGCSKSIHATEVKNENRKDLVQWKSVQKLIKTGDSIILLETKDEVETGPKFNLRETRIKKLSLLVPNDPSSLFVINGITVAQENIYFRYQNAWINLDWFLGGDRYADLGRIDWDWPSRIAGDDELDMMQPASELIYVDENDHIQYPEWMGIGKIGNRPVVFSFTGDKGKLSGCYFFLDGPCPYADGNQFCISSVAVFSGKKDHNGIISAGSITRNPADSIAFLGLQTPSGQIRGIWTTRQGRLSMSVAPIFPDKKWLGLYRNKDGNFFRIERLCNGKYLRHGDDINSDRAYLTEFFFEGYLSESKKIKWPMMGDSYFEKDLPDGNIEICSEDENAGCFKKVFRSKQ